MSISKKHGIFAVGISDTGRNRYQSSRVALALALFKQAADSEEEVPDLETMPAFKAILDTMSDDFEVPPAEPIASPVKKRQEEAVVAPVKLKKQAAGAPEPSGKPFPRNEPFWITLAE